MMGLCCDCAGAMQPCPMRAAAAGVLVAFDKHMNLVLRDVEERYTVLLRVQKVKPPRAGTCGCRCHSGAGAARRQGSHPASSMLLQRPELCLLLNSLVRQCVIPCCPAGVEGSCERVRWVRQQEHRRRQLRQVFVRGDSVVLVAAASAAGNRNAAAAAGAASSRPAG
jgi:small nuclear ribonucleoprotein (snRNP)-like protein